MVQRSRFWDGAATGDAIEAPYDASTETSEVLASLSGSRYNTHVGGVWHDETSALSATTPAANVVRIGNGRAQVYGTWYNNDANVDIAIPNPTTATRIDTIVLRKSWSAQTVRLTRLAGVDGGAAPALTQIVGTTWDVPLWNVSINTSGVITLTDRRSFISLSATSDSVGNFTPTAGIRASSGSSYDIGSASAVWSQVWANYISNPNSIRVNTGNGFALMPATDNQTNLGTATNRWSVIYSVNGTLQTSRASDKRIINQLSGGETLQKIKNMKIYRFHYLNSAGQPDTRFEHVGFMAEDVDQDFLVGDGSVSAQNTASLAIAAIQELQAQIDAIRAVLPTPPAPPAPVRQESK